MPDKFRSHPHNSKMTEPPAYCYASGSDTVRTHGTEAESMITVSGRKDNIFKGLSMKTTDEEQLLETLICSAEQAKAELEAAEKNLIRAYMRFVLSFFCMISAAAIVPFVIKETACMALFIAVSLYLLIFYWVYLLGKKSPYLSKNTTLKNSLYTEYVLRAEEVYAGTDKQILTPAQKAEYEFRLKRLAHHEL